MSITLIIIALNVAFTLAGWSFPKLQNNAMLWPFRVWHERQWQTLVTSAFLHANGTHLIFNMVTLLFFGPALEGILGTGRFLLLYAVSLVLAGLPSVFRHRNNPNYATLGASGAVSGVLFSYIVYMPMSKIYTFFVPIGIPAAIFGAVYLAYTFWESRRQRGIINHDAHLAGALAGIVLTLLMDPTAALVFLTAVGLR